MRLFNEVRNNLTRQLNNWRSSVDSSKVRALLITSNNSVSQSQIYPFYFYRNELKLKLDFTFFEVDIEHYANFNSRYGGKIDIVFYQPWFDIERSVLHSHLNKIKNENPGAKVIFLDGFAPLDLRMAELVNSYVDVYVKKHVFKDESKYFSSTKGDTNLMEYYGYLYGIDYPDTSFSVDLEFMKKIRIGPSFVTSSEMLPYFVKKSKHSGGNRDIDLHARLGGAGSDWYGKMRAQARAAVADIRTHRIQFGSGVTRKQYMDEMSRSKICFSPFGFGEVCWRDYEAVLCGALLIKPNMDHVSTFPNIFEDKKYYVSINWDFSDLQEKVDYYLNNEYERLAIVNDAYEVLHKYAASSMFVDFISEIVVTDES